MGNFTQEGLAKRMGKSQSTVANKMRLLTLTNEVQMALMNNLISERHARSLLKIEDKTEQRNVLAEIISNRLTVRQTDELIKEKFKFEKGSIFIVMVMSETDEVLNNLDDYEEYRIKKISFKINREENSVLLNEAIYLY